MKFLTYNLRNARFREEQNTDVLNNWRFRRKAVLEVIRRADPDVLALQEDNEEQLKAAGDALEKTHAVYCDRAFYDADISFNAVFMRKTIPIIASGAFWIAADGRTQGKIEGSLCTRHATYVRLKVADAPLLVVNVHLDHATDPAFKRKEMETFVGLLRGIAGERPGRTIVMGDFNSTPETQSHRLMEEFGLRDAARMKSKETPTCAHWAAQPAHERIDYIWLSGDLADKLTDYTVIAGDYRRKDGSTGHASDHSAVFAQVEI
jgi:endonuclease/exonuclease/phosphatase family metal-dependent hydrolase